MDSDSSDSLEMQYHSNPMRTSSLSSPTLISSPHLRSLSDTNAPLYNPHKEEDDPFRSKVFDVRGEGCIKFNDVRCEGGWVVACASDGRVYYKKNGEGKRYEPIEIVTKEEGGGEYFGVKCCCFHPRIEGRVYVGTYEGFGNAGRVLSVDLEKGGIVEGGGGGVEATMHSEAIFGMAVSDPERAVEVEECGGNPQRRTSSVSSQTPLLISVSWDKSAIIYRLNAEGGWSEGDAFKKVEHNREILSVAISPNAQIFCLGGGRDVMVYRMPWNVGEDDLAQPSHLYDLEGYSEHVNCLCFSRAAPFKLFSGSDDHSVKVWDCSSKTDECKMDLDPKKWTLMKTLVGHRDKVKCIAESPCGKYLCSGSGDHEIHHTSNVSHQQNASQNAHHHHKRLHEKDKTCRIWDIDAGVELRSLYGHSQTVRGVAFVDKMKIVSASEDATCRQWNIAVEEKKRTILDGFETKYGVRGFVMSKNGQIIVSQTDETVQVWNHTIKGDEKRMTLEKNARSVVSVAVTKDGKTAVTAGENDKRIIFWKLDPKLGTDPPNYGDERLSGASSTRNPQDVDKRVINCFTMQQDISLIAYAPDEKSLFVALTKGDDSGSLLKLVSLKGEVIRSYRDPDVLDPPTITALAISGTHREEEGVASMLIAGAEDGSILVFDLNGDEDKVADVVGAHSDKVGGVAISRDDSKVVTVSNDSTAVLWDMAVLKDPEVNPKKPLHTFEEHSSPIHSADIHLSGKYLVTASHDKTWRLWHLVKPYSLIYTNNESHDMSVRCCSFSPDGKYVITGSKDKTISIEEFDSHLHRLPSSVHRSFLADCKLEDKTPGEYSWDNSDTKMALTLVPHSLLEPRFDKKEGTNLIHLAASKGRNNFLKTALLASPDDLEKQKLAFLALMREDENGDTPLKYAVKAESDPVVKVLLDCYNKLFKQEHALPFHKDNTSQEIHPTERFPLEEFNDVCLKHPSLALKFVSVLSLVTSDDLAVQEGVERYNFRGAIRQIIKGSDTRVPRGFWKQRLFEGESGPDATSTGIPVMAKIVPIKGVASKDSKFLQRLVEAARKKNFISAFENEVIEAIINHKWRTYVRKKFDRHMYLYLALVAAITIDAITFKKYVYVIEGTTFVKCLGFFPMVVVIMLWLFFTEHECSQYRNAESKRKYFFDLWNIIDCASLCSIFLTYSMRVVEMRIGRITQFHKDHAEEDLFWSTLLLSFAVVATYLNILYFLQGVQKRSGQLVRVILGIFSDMQVFVGIALTCLVGFSVGFYVLFEGSESFQNENIVASIFTSYTLMLSEFDFSGEYLGKSSDIIATCILFFTFTFGINIVMLNLLIAIMGDTFDRIQENSQAEFMYARAQIVLEYEGNLSEEEKNNPDWFPTWLQVLVPTLQEREGDHENWVGRVRELKNTMKNEIGDLTNKLNESEKRRRVEQEERKKQTVKMEGKLEETNEKIEELLTLVRSLKKVNPRKI
ncbi:hypothetical protein TrST_g7001 [Triparma strigata]|uniref:Ion transport domain-containing protein n=1 Tax=Triparma strigata TaxID=1606541 RepID=A0A9W7C3D4_9STRA|nr:hypothetical protein TrST_g7001 [Triparma strigata]